MQGQTVNCSYKIYIVRSFYCLAWYDYEFHETKRKNNAKITNVFILVYLSPSRTHSLARFILLLAVLLFFLHSYNFDIIFKFTEDLKHTRRHLKSTHTHAYSHTAIHKHINAHYCEWKIIATIFRLSAYEDEVMQLKNDCDWMQPFPKVSREGIRCTVWLYNDENVYLKMNEGIIKQRITDTIALILDRYWNSLGCFDLYSICCIFISERVRVQCSPKFTNPINGHCTLFMVWWFLHANISH